MLARVGKGTTWDELLREVLGERGRDFVGEVFGKGASLVLHIKNKKCK